MGLLRYVNCFETYLINIWFPLYILDMFYFVIQIGNYGVVSSYNSKGWRMACYWVFGKPWPCTLHWLEQERATIFASVRSESEAMWRDGAKNSVFNLKVQRQQNQDQQTSQCGGIYKEHCHDWGWEEESHAFAIRRYWIGCHERRTVCG